MKIMAVSSVMYTKDDIEEFADRLEYSVEFDDYGFHMEPVKDKGFLPTLEAISYDGPETEDDDGNPIPSYELDFHLTFPEIDTTNTAYDDIVYYADKWKDIAEFVKDCKGTFYVPTL